MSPPASVCGTTPRRAMIWPPRPGMRILRPLRSASDLILRRNQPPNCTPVLAPAAGVHPGNLLARIQTEGQRGLEGEGHVFADVVVAGGLAALNRALADR